MKKIYLFFGIFLFQIIFFSNSSAQSNNFNIENYKQFLESHRNISSGALMQLYNAGMFESNIHLNDSSAVYFDSIDAKYNLTSYEKSLLQKNGFVISERLNGTSFGGAFMQIFQKDLPVFVLDPTFNCLSLNPEVEFLGHMVTPFFCVCVFLPFLGPLPRYMEVPTLGVESEL